MSQINREQLLDYIKTAIGLETDIVIQQDVMRQYDENSLARKPQLQLKKEPTEPIEPLYESYKPYPVAIVAAVLGAFLILGNIVGAASSQDPDGGPALVFGCLIGFLFFIPLIKSKSTVQKRNEAKRDDYEAQMESYNTELPKIREQNSAASFEYYSNIEAWQTSDTDNRAVLTDHLTETQSILDKLYDLDYIYPKYRTLPALTSIYEYLVTGRCEELSGPHGAYNLYEDEVRKDTVISQLNTVIANLEQIKQNQYMLYQQVKAIQKNTSVIAAEITQIRGYTAAITQLSALNAYYSALTARNTGITAAYNLLN